MHRVLETAAPVNSDCFHRASRPRPRLSIFTSPRFTDTNVQQLGKFTVHFALASHNLFLPTKKIDAAAVECPAGSEGLGSIRPNPDHRGRERLLMCWNKLHISETIFCRFIYFIYILRQHAVFDLQLLQNFNKFTEKFSLKCYKCTFGPCIFARIQDETFFFQLYVTKDF